MRDVAIIGVGLQKWGELWEKSFRDLFVEAALNRHQQRMQVPV